MRHLVKLLLILLLLAPQSSEAFWSGGFCGSLGWVTKSLGFCQTKVSEVALPIAPASENTNAQALDQQPPQPTPKIDTPVASVTTINKIPTTAPTVVERIVEQPIYNTYTASPIIREILREVVIKEAEVNSSKYDFDEFVDYDFLDKQIDRVYDRISSIDTSNLNITGTLSDRRGSDGNAGYILQSTGDGVEWVATSTISQLGSDIDLSTSEVTGVLGVGSGGTGLSTYATGDLLVASGANTLGTLAAGSDGQFLSLTSGTPTWTAALTGSSLTVTGATTVNTLNAASTTINGHLNVSGATTTLNSGLTVVGGETELSTTSVNGTLTATDAIEIGTSSDNQLRFANALNATANIQLRKDTGQSILNFDAVAVDGISGSFVRFFRNTNTTGSRALIFHQGDGSSAISGRISVNGGHSYFNANGGNVGIGTSTTHSRLTVAGNITPATTGIHTLGTSDNLWEEIFATNNIINTSDRTLKTDIIGFDQSGGRGYGIDTIMELNPVSYTWIDNKNGTRLGFIAQDVQDIIPEVVHEGDNGLLGMRYTELIPVLVQSVQDVWETVTGNTEKIEDLEERIAQLERQSSTPNDIRENNEEIVESTNTPATEVIVDDTATSTEETASSTTDLETTPTEAVKDEEITDVDEVSTSTDEVADNEELNSEEKSQATDTIDIENTNTDDGAVEEVIDSTETEEIDVEETDTPTEEEIVTE